MIHKIIFGKIYLIEPEMIELDGQKRPLYPGEARSRNLSYSAGLHVDVSQTITKEGHDGEAVTTKHDISGLFLGKVPVMVRTKYCNLFQKTESQMIDVRECVYDQGGYFIINGSEKVIISQDRMSTNQVHVFQNRQPNKYAFVAEIRSIAESQRRPPSTMFGACFLKLGVLQDNI